MKALVIGASSQTGGALLGALERAGIEAVGTYFSRSGRGTIKLDVRDASAVEKCFESVQPQIVFLSVINKGGANYCEAHPDETRALNVDATQVVAQSCKKHNAKLVFYSSDYVFDGKSGPYSEEDAPNPLSVYGKTKWEAEKLIEKTLKDYLIIRTTAVYGWDRTSPNFAMQIWEELSAGKSMKVANDQWGNPTLVDFLAETSVRLVEMKATGIVNVVGKDRVNRVEWAKALAKAMALDSNLIQSASTSELKQTSPRPLNAGLKTEKLAELIGTEPLDLNESLKRFRRQWRAETYVAHGPSKAQGEAEKLKQEIFEKVRKYYQLVHKPQSFAPMKSRVQYAGRVFGEEEIVNLVDSSLDFWLTLGPYGEQFETKMRKFFNSKDFIVVNSGSTANLNAILALMSEQLERPLNAGDEVITPAVTFPTTLAPIVHGGMIPVIVDCEVGTYNINPHLIEKAISPKTRAIFVPHTLGNPCDMDILCEIAKKHNLYLIEDSCDALGSKFRDKLVGTFGDLATLSFFPAHHMTLGEGGAVIINNPKLSRIARSVRDWGRDCWCAPGESNTCGKRFGWQMGDLPKGYDHKYIYTNLGYNFKPTDMQAAIGVAQADRLPDFIAARKSNFKALYKALEPFQDRLILPKIDPRMDVSWFGFPITVQNGLSRAELVGWLENANIETRGVFSGNILKQPVYKNIKARIVGNLDQTDRIMNDTFFIGVYPGLKPEMLQFVIQRFQEFFAKQGARV